MEVKMKIVRSSLTTKVSTKHFLPKVGMMSFTQKRTGRNRRDNSKNNGSQETSYFPLATL